MTYLWVGIGSALGGIGRYWLQLAMVALTGPQFPWGTILINVVGSFVIGFFGALTAPDGPFSVPSDMRTFVMTGLCGGFTTFSAFSLQTYELAQDGHWFGAAGNILLSVVLCLAAVAFGYVAAGWVHGAPLKAP